MRMPTEKLKGLKVRDFMATSVMSLTPDMSVSEAVQILVKYRYSGAPVVDAYGKLMGMFSEKDCLRAAVVLDPSAAEEALVGDLMSIHIESVSPEDDLQQVAERFLKAPYKRFPVLENHALVGQISRTDLLRAIDRLLRESDA